MQKITTLIKLFNICHMSADNHYPILLKVLFRWSLDSYHSLCFVLSPQPKSLAVTPAR